MITTTTTWQTANAQPAKQPIYVLQIGGQAQVYSTHSLASNGITGTLPTCHPWLKTPQGNSQTIDVINGTSSIGDLQCEIIDVGGAIRTLVAGTLEGSTVTLSVGYPGLAWPADFAVLATYVLYKINPTDGYTSFLFTARDPQVLTKKTIYTHPANGYLLSDDNPWYLCGTPAEIYQAVALWALGLPASAIDRATLVALDSPAEGIFSGWRPFQFSITSSFEAKQFLESEVLRPSGMYPVVTNTGQLSLRCMRAPAAGAAPVFTFTQDNMTILPRWDRQPIVNEAVWQFDYDGSQYANYETFLQATSISTYDRGTQFSISSKGLQTALGAFGFAEWVSSRLFRRFAGVAPGIKGGAPILGVQAFLLTLPVWVGDYVAVTHPMVPDITTGALGIANRIYEVIDRQPDYANGYMGYKLLDTGITGHPAAYQFGTAPARPFVIGSSPVY